jgi:hypothetical protein
MNDSIADHLSEDMLWSAITERQPLNESQIDHTDECRDCREFVQELTGEAKRKGLAFPDLLSKS